MPYLYRNFCSMLLFVQLHCNNDITRACILNNKDIDIYCRLDNKGILSNLYTCINSVLDQLGNA
jgi:hypothetical protein